jgi:choline dehydrogenase-like flavoprotein
MNTRQEFDYIIVGARSAGCVAVDLFAQPNLSKVRRVLPASDKEADIVAFIEQRTRANYHPACTCAIGRCSNVSPRQLTPIQRYFMC